MFQVQVRKNSFPLDSTGSSASYCFLNVLALDRTVVVIYLPLHCLIYSLISQLFLNFLPLASLT